MGLRKKKCKRCGVSTETKTWGTARTQHFCPVCLDGLDNSVQQIKIVLEPIKPNYRQTMIFYATEYNGSESKIGKLTNFYMIIQLIARLLEQYEHIVIVKEKLKETGELNDSR